MSEQDKAANTNNFENVDLGVYPREWMVGGGWPYSAHFETINNQTDALKVTSFGFAIPSGATINGIEITTTRAADANTAYNYIDGFWIHLIHPDSGNTDPESDSDNWPDSPTQETWGGSLELWGESWSADNINDSSFGVYFGGLVGYGSSLFNKAYITECTVTVYYTGGGSGPSSTARSYGVILG